MNASSPVSALPSCSRSRRQVVIRPAARSRAPSSTISGTPLRTQSQRLAEPLPGRRSIVARTASPPQDSRRSRPAISSQRARTAASSGVPRSTGRIATWSGATAGGRRSPSSSLWVMISAPISRVEAPQEVV
jgi:hypothetical protein